jgi:membrane protease YdiL (CAAX protease family)
MRLMKDLGLTLLLFVLVYAPASMLAMQLHLSLAAAVPFVMVATLLVAAALIFGFSRRWPGGFSRFGFRAPMFRYLGWAVVVGAPLAVVSALSLRLAHEPGPLAGLTLAPWLAVLYFVIGAPVQEEVIFRGLLQTVLTGRADTRGAAVPTRGLLASLLIAVLFGGIHIAVGPYTAGAAFVLGIMAGELRRRSGSLLPAMICHALFNLAGIIWP